jgi:hypothetical protein
MATFIFTYRTLTDLGTDNPAEQLRSGSTRPE